jgi:hypothetical protein
MMRAIGCLSVPMRLCHSLRRPLTSVATTTSNTPTSAATSTTIPTRQQLNVDAISAGGNVDEHEYHSVGIRKRSAMDHAAAVSAIAGVLKDNQRVYVHTAAATPRVSVAFIHHYSQPHERASSKCPLLCLDVIECDGRSQGHREKCRSSAYAH